MRVTNAPIRKSEFIQVEGKKKKVEEDQKSH